MIRMRFFGRGGQGAVTGVVLLGKSIKNKESLLFPLFGVERRGAPVKVFLYVDSKKITKRESILKDSDFDILFDETLLDSVYKNESVGVKKKGLILINSKKTVGEIVSRYKFLKDHKIAVVPATHIALENNVVTGTGAAVNTAMLGAVSRVTKIVSVEDLRESITEEFGPNAKKNIRAAEEAYQKTTFGYGV